MVEHYEDRRSLFKKNLEETACRFVTIPQFTAGAFRVPSRWTSRMRPERPTVGVLEGAGSGRDPHPTRPFSGRGTGLVRLQRKDDLTMTTRCGQLTEAILLAMACLSPWAFGTVRAWAEAGLYLGVALVALLARSGAWRRSGFAAWPGFRAWPWPGWACWRVAGVGVAGMAGRAGRPRGRGVQGGAGAHRPATG